MSTKRDTLFPSTSIGRVQGTNLQRKASQEMITTHPLLSPAPSTTSPTAQSPPSPEAAVPAHGTSTPPRYIPYTPRQRVAPTPATTGTTIHSSISAAPQPHQGGATGKLQLMNLKAAAQNIGLDVGSVGWAILETLVGESDHTQEWNDIWNAITTGKATLVLPLEQASAHEKVTSEFVKDHIVLADDSRNNAPIVTLSGLRGTLTDETLTIRSSLQPSSKLFQALLTPSSRASTLANLPPLPNISPTLHLYPVFSLPSYTSLLPIPPRTAGPSKPTLPPRPGARLSSSPGSSSRISNPFASLFGKPTATPLSRPNTPPPPSQHDIEHVVEVSAFTIDRRIVRKDVGKEITKALKTEIKESLAGTPSWVVDRVQNFSVGLYPLVKAPKKSPPPPEGGVSPPPSPYMVNASEEIPEELSEKFQDFYALLEQDLRAGGSPLLGRRREDVSADDDRERERRVESDSRVREILESVERTICTLFYDKLFLPSTSDDASHDEALTSRIAALNMLDLSLEHLDVHIGDAGPGLDVVVRACGETLTQLDVACRSPADKAAVLVAAHKIVVDGLSKLPPIRLKSEGESKEWKASSPVVKRDALSVDTDSQPAETHTTESITNAPSSQSPTAIASSPISIPVVHTPDETDANKTLTAAPSASSSTDDKGASRPVSPLLTVSPAEPTTPVSGDVLLPLIIFAVVKTNPPHLVSQLLYTQRFRNQSFGGEESYCLINLMAVAEFLENVDLGALGLGDSEDKVISTADLTPIPINRAGLSADVVTSNGLLPASLRGRVEQQVDAIAGSANKVILGVVDSSFGVLRSLLPGTPGDPAQPAISADLQSSAPWNSVKPGFGLLRRESGFSISSLVPGSKDRTKSVSSHVEESGQQLVAVSSRPGSVKSEYANSEDETSSSDKGEDDDDGQADEDEDDEDGDDGAGAVNDGRSIRSFESMMSGKSRDRKEAIARKSLSDRLAHMAGLPRLSQPQPTHKDSPPPSRRTSLLPPPPVPSNRFDTPASSRGASPVSFRLAPPHQRFMECAEEDLKISEVGELLREYRKLVEGVRNIGGFDI
ncbi:hypothetical protein PLICRDRAFT_42742 [Plicaturopsis crispa FD-325 SS-3]|nr:hypothetical protein PLICRDRAFT_42742 [Plicaturopsis crispa FD-325 SS-3]